MTAQLITVADLTQAFAICREKNRPISVECNDKLFKVFPSGRCEPQGKSGPSTVEKGTK